MATAFGLVSLEAYLAKEVRSRRKHEYVEGVVYALAGANARHNLLVSNLLYLFRRRAEGTPCRVFPSDMRLKVGNRIYYPDLSVVCHPVDLEALYLEDACLVVEVLSAKTANIDAREKRTAYLTLPGLKAYLMVDSRRPSLILYRKGERGIEEARDRIHLPCLEMELTPEEVYRF
ncbi:MAG: Uma2 family endonuclease [Thermus caldifontis]|uniref:Uma2 family endonuclease n=1 Tax=Thermus caldifontis TaxID=1930763 RepID=UPI000DF1577F|nr:Uma2 family endonuclease [Thermus caldifontis]